ncbi:hypothetical protein [Vacuolonema iberomarrocanum]|uniref:hypothetical protein n=1 Tax=Vacuolonema iberomarrocanum TaxID=3454632 RepID=UPI0019F2A31E|nr:hypothetical protein [filamentous cyanobacterium LEGE 07170]
MLDFSIFTTNVDIATLADFSRQHCLGICAALVPANMIATLQTLIFAGTQRPRRELSCITTLSLLYATLMVLHVVSWFVVGVVMAPTFVLLSLALVCIGLNGWAIAAPTSLGGVVRSLVMVVVRRLRQWNRLTPQT